MKHTKRIAALLLALALCFSCAACSKTVGSYRVVKTLGTEQFRIGFRDGDQAAVYVNAALKVLAADGTIHSLALKWFGTDNTTFDSDANALDALGDIPQRTFIMGLNEERFPCASSTATVTAALTSSSRRRSAPASAGRCSISRSRTRTPMSSSQAAMSTVPGAAWCSTRPTARTARTRKSRR